MKNREENQKVSLSTQPKEFGMMGVAVLTLCATRLFDSLSAPMDETVTSQSGAILLSARYLIQKHGRGSSPRGT